MKFFKPSSGGGNYFFFLFVKQTIETNTATTEDLRAPTPSTKTISGQRYQSEEMLTTSFTANTPEKGIKYRSVTYSTKFSFSANIFYVMEQYFSLFIRST